MSILNEKENAYVEGKRKAYTFKVAVVKFDIITKIKDCLYSNYSTTRGQLFKINDVIDSLKFQI